MENTLLYTVTIKIRRVGSNITVAILRPGYPIGHALVSTPRWVSLIPKNKHI